MERELSSFRDPSGHLYHHAGQIFRQVNAPYSAHYDHLKTSGLYQALTEAGLLIPHEECAPEEAGAPTSAWKILSPERVGFISYPYEWPFGLYKEAALTTLKIQEIALDHGMTLKDASAYNIQVHKGRCLLIDTLSFEKYEKGTPWIAYRQFCQHFLAPLSLMARVGPETGLLMRDFIDGIPLDLACRMLPYTSRFSPGLGMHLFLHAGSQSKHAGNQKSASKSTVTLHSLKGMIDNLASTIEKLELPRKLQTEWSNYHEKHNYSNRAHDEKAKIVEAFVKKVSPESVWDLGANTGNYSRIAARTARQVVALDIDPLCTHMLHGGRENAERTILPLTMNLANPSPGIGWAGSERQSLTDRGPADVAMALALIHHLAIVNNVPLSGIASYFSSLGKHLIIEWIPKSDSQIQLMLKNRRDIFGDYSLDSFERHFGESFEILEKVPVPESERTLYLMRRHE